MYIHQKSAPHGIAVVADHKREHMRKSKQSFFSATRSRTVNSIYFTVEQVGGGEPLRWLHSCIYIWWQMTSIKKIGYLHRIGFAHLIIRVCKRPLSAVATGAG